MEELEDENDDPSGCEDGNDRCHSCQKRFEDFSNARVFGFFGLSDRIDGGFAHGSQEDDHGVLLLTTLRFVD